MFAHRDIYVCMYVVLNRKVIQNTELCIALCSVLGVLIVGHELMRSESHIVVCKCVYTRGSHLESHACGSYVVLSRL